MSAKGIAITLPDGSVRSYPDGTTVREIAQSIGPRMGRDAVGAFIDDGPLVDVHTPPHRDARLRIVTVKSPEGLEVLRHSASHVMASAVQKLFPETQVTFGPAIAREDMCSSPRSTSGGLASSQ